MLMFKEPDRDRGEREPFTGGRANEFFMDEGLEPFIVFVVFVISIRFRDFDEDTLSVLCKILFFEKNVCLLCCDTINSMVRETCVCECCLLYTSRCV